MILTTPNGGAMYIGIPRESGDDPVVERLHNLVDEYSPRERG